MADFQQLLDQATAIPTSTAGTDLVSQKRQSVAQVADQKKATLSPAAAIPDFYQVASGVGNDRGANSMGQIESDVRTLRPYELVEKYGDAGLSLQNQAVDAGTELFNDKLLARNRSGGQAVWDTASGVLSGGLGSLAGLGALGVGLIDEQTGVQAGQAVQDGMAWAESTQSDAVNASRRIQRAASSLDARDNTAEYEQDVADGELLPGLRRWGKDVIDTLGNSLDDPSMVGQGTSEAVGSLLAGGPLAKGLRAIGSASLSLAGKARLVNTPGAAALAAAGGRVATDDDTYRLGAAMANARNPALLGAEGTERLIRAGDYAAWPGAIAGMEAGGAYSGTAAEVMGMSHEQLMETSPSYRELSKTLPREEAQRQVADNAAKQAALIQGAVGFATGGLSRWAETPFKTPSLGAAVTNALAKEPLEEAIQGTTGGMAQNFAIQQNADDTRDISEGVGEQTAMGALYGLAAAGTTQSPGAALYGTTAIAGKALEGMAVLGQTLFTGAKDQANRMLDAAEAKSEAASPLSEQNIQAASEEARGVMPELMQSLDAMIEVAEGTTEEERNAEKAYVASLAKTLEISPEELASLPPSVQAVVAGAVDRATATHKLARQIAKMTEETPERLEAVTAYAQLTAPFRDLQEPELPILNNMEEGNIRKMFQGVRGVIRNANNTPVDRKANDRIDQIVAQEAIKPVQVSDAAIATPEGQAAAQQAAALMTLRPGTGSIEVAQQLLKHSNNGTVGLTPVQKRAVFITLKMLEAQERNIKARAGSNLKPVDLVNQQIMSDDSRDPLSTKDENPYKLPARSHVEGVLNAMRSGNLKSAASLLKDFGLFAQHMQNKLEAFNDHFNSDGKKNFSFQALSPDGDRKFYPSKPYIFVNKKNADSVRLAQKVATEAGVLADIYNGLVEILPELKQSKITPISLDPALVGDSQQIVDGLNKAPAQTAPTPAAKPAATKQPEVVSTPVEAKEVVSTETPAEENQEEPAVTNTQWFKSDRQDIRPDDGRARMKIGNTMITYDREGDLINIRNVFTPKDLRTGGSGRNAMNKFLALTDELGLPTELSVAGYSKDTDPVKLRKFYNSLGFTGESDKLTRAVGAEAVKPAPVVSRITIEQVKTLTDEGLAERAAVLDAKKNNKTATAEDLATLDVIDDETTARVVAATKTTEQEEEVEQEEAPTVEPHPNANPKLAERFPKLAFIGSAFSLLTAMLPTNNSRLADQESPAMLVIDALSSQDDLEDLLSKETKHILTNDLVKAYAQLLSEGSPKNRMNLGGLIEVMRDSARAFVKKNRKEFDKRDQGKMHRWRNGKAANALNENGEYDENLLQSAGLAALQWMLTARQQQNELTNEDYERITGLDGETLDPKIKERISNGMTEEDVKFAIATKIREYWGLRPNAETVKGYADGISEAMASEVIEAMIEVGFMQEPDLIELTPEMGVMPNKETGVAEVKTIKRYKLAEEGYPKVLRQFPSAIDQVALTDAQQARYIDGDMPPIARTQMNNPSVENTKEQQRTVKKANSIPSKLSLPMYNAYQALGVNGVVTLFGKVKAHWNEAQDLDPENFDPDHLKALEGRLLNITNAYEEIEATTLEMANRAEKAGKLITEMEIRFAHNISKVGRLQMLGAYNAQTNKVMREVMLPTWSKLNLADNTEHLDAFHLAIAQHLGVKVHKVAPDVAIADAKKSLNSTYAPLVEYLQEWANGVDLQALPDKKKIASLDPDKILSLLGDESLSEAGFHSLVEYARFLNMNKDARKNFETGLYLEADGVTNGPIMAMMMLTLGKFRPEWVKNVRKGGVHFGRRMPLHELIAQSEEDSFDLYKTATNEMVNKRDALLSNLEKQKDRAPVKESFRALDVVMAALFGKDAFFNPVTGEMTFDRGIAKNPLTITIYGSSAEGIAGNFASQVMDLLAEQRTEIKSRQALDPSLTDADIVFKGDQVKWDEYAAALELLSMTVLGKDKDRYYRTQAQQGKKNSSYKAMQTNFLYGFVEPMVGGISETVTAPLMKSVRLLRQATQVQSIFLEKAYQEEINKALEDKAKDPEWQKIDFLSQEDLTAIDKKMAKRFPNIQTSSQVFRVAKSKRNFDGQTIFSESYNNKHPTGAVVYAPTNAGVSGIATLVIGFGDAYMVQVSVNDPVMTGNLNVFDGINMPLDKIKVQGEAVNSAAYKAFLQNPMKAVEQSYSSFLAQIGDVTEIVDEKMLKDLARAFQEEGELPLEPSEILSGLSTMMSELGRNIAWSAKSIDARHAAMEDVPVSVDHMASANSPYTNGVELQEMSQDELLTLLNERYEYHMANPPVPVEKPLAFGERDEKSNAQIFHTEDLATLAQRIDLTKDQQVIMQELIGSLAAKGYTIVSGTLKEIRKYRADRGLSNEDIRAADNGMMSVTEKRIYLINANGEVLTHELVHAATYETLLAHFMSENPDPVVKQAVDRLMGLMKIFMEEPVDQTLPFEVKEAIADAQASINGHLESDTVEGDVAALNEFMAWTLSNQALMNTLKTKQVPKYLQWAKDVITAIKQMLWGTKKSLKVGTDFLSNIQFNTSILMHNVLTPAQMFDKVTLYHTTNARGDLTTLRKTFGDLIVSELKQVSPENVEAVTKRQAKYEVQVEEMAKRTAGIFDLNSLETSTMVAMVTAMGTEMQLNSDIMARAQTLYTHVQKNLEVGSFLEGGAVDPQVDSHQAQGKFDLVMGKSDRLTDSMDRTTLLPVFIALASVSGKFREVLSNIKPPKADKQEGTFDNWVRQVSNDAMHTLSTRLSGEKHAMNVQAAMDILTLRLNKTLVEEHNNIDRIETGIDQGSLGLNAKIRDGLTSLSDKGMDVGRKLETSATSRLQKNAGRLIQLTAGLASEKNGDQVAEGMLKTAERTNLNNAFLNFARDIIGRTEATADVYDLIKPIRAAVQQIRQQFRDSVPKVIDEAFKKAPTKEQYATMFRSMGKTDLAALIGLIPKADMGKLFSEAGFLDKQIDDLEAKLQSMDPKHFTLLQKKMKQLANHMNKGVTGSNLLRNSHAVARLWGERTAPNRQSVSTELETVVDQLTTLYALDTLAPADKKSMASLVQGEADGVGFILSYLEGQRKTEIAKTKRAKARGNYFKGYMHSLPSKAGHLIVADDSEFVSLQQRGYSRVRNYTGSSVMNTGQSRGYYYSDIPARAAFAQGMMQNVDQTAYGIDPATGFSHDLTAGRIVSKRLVDQLAASMHRERNSTENLMPIYNEKGRVIAFEQSMDPLETARLDKSDQIHEMLGVWRGRQIEERFSVQQNKVLIDTLHTAWERDRKDHPDLYVNLFDKSVLDAVERDAVSLFSDEAKAHIEEKFGPGVFMVRRAMLEDVTGYRNPSVSDFWTNINRLDASTNKAVKQTLVSLMGPSAYSKLVKMEQLIQGAVADIRTIVIVKSMVVPAVNMISNVYQLISRGVNPIQIVKDTPSTVTQLHSYMESRLEQIRLEAKLRAVGNDTSMEARLRAKIRSISDSHRRLEIWPLIEAGEFSTVADVGMSRDDLQLTSGRLDEWVGNQIDKLPPALQTAARYGLITKETALFQGLQKTVQYGDFVAKAILYKHLIKKEGLTKEQALARITEEFVNYDRLPGRSRGGLENMGMLWFYNFKLRTVKVGLSTLRNNPLHAFLMMILPAPTGVGTPIDENLFVKGAEGSLGYTIGPGIAMRAPFMHPIYQLLN